jgi:TatA/E family protein of Tat protein translocase
MEILLIVVLVFLLFGANKFPGMMKNLAEGLKTFKKELKSKPAHDKPASKKNVKNLTSRKPFAKKTDRKKPSNPRNRP